MSLFRKAREVAAAVTGAGELPEFHPATMLREWGSMGGFTLGDAKTGVAILGATGSGKTSGPGKHLALAYLAHGFGFLVLCAKPEEAQQWREWAALTGRSDDIREINEKGDFTYNFMAEAAKDPQGGLTLNLTNLLMEVAGAITRGAGKADDSGGNDKFWSDSLRNHITNCIDICLLSKQELTLSRLRDIANSAPLSLDQAASESFRAGSDCCKAITEASKLTRDDPYARANVRECATYFLKDWPQLADKTRSIIQLTFTLLMRPFLTQPLFRIFAEKTTVRPEDTFEGRIILVNVPAQVYKDIGVCCGVLLKYITQLTILKRSEPGQGRYLRPVCIWSDEAQTFISDYDYIFQSVARSASGCTVYVFQNTDTLIAKLGNEHKVYSLLANLQAKFFCQNTHRTAEYASQLLGERWTSQVSTSVSASNNPERAGGGRSTTGGTSTSLHKRHYVEAAEFAQLARGGPQNGYRVQCIVYNGGQAYPDPAGGAEALPYALLTFDQR